LRSAGEKGKTLRLIGGGGYGNSLVSLPKWGTFVRKARKNILATKEGKRP